MLIIFLFYGIYWSFCVYMWVWPNTCIFRQCHTDIHGQIQRYSLIRVKVWYISIEFTLLIMFISNSTFLLILCAFNLKKRKADPDNQKLDLSVVAGLVFSSRPAVPLLDKTTWYLKSSLRDCDENKNKTNFIILSKHRLKKKVTI